MSDLQCDSPFEFIQITPTDRIVQRLFEKGFPVDGFHEVQPVLVLYIKENKFRIPELVSAVLPTNDDVNSVSGSASMDTNLRDLFRESMVWLQWLMFEGDPGTCLKQISESNIGQRGVCGAVWGKNDIAYRCRTCEHDPTCAICVPCFQNGNHKDHDYSIIYTGGGCCDCGDVTAWNSEGFCSKHMGAEHIRPLSNEYANSVGPVLDALLILWRTTLMSVETFTNDVGRRDVQTKKASDELAFVIVEMLCEFCDCSESLLSFVSERISAAVGLLDSLVKAETFLGKQVVSKLHNFLLKLLAEPVFKYEFAKVFLVYYPSVINEVIKASSDKILKEQHPLLLIFSVQIFTVPVLTSRLVNEMNLLTILLGCLGDIFVSCAGDDGRLQVSKWENLYETTIRVVEDIRFVLSHDAVPKYVTDYKQDISRTWMKLLPFVQGTNPQKRETGRHIEEENEHTSLPFILGISIENIHTLLVDGAFSISDAEGIHLNTDKEDLDDEDTTRHAKVGRISQESSVFSPACDSVVSKISEMKSEIVPYHLIPPTFIWMISECLRAIEDWLKVDKNLINVLSPTVNNIHSNFLAFKKTLSKIRNGNCILRLSGSTEDHDKKSASSHNVSHMSIDMDDGQSIEHGCKSIITDTDYGGTMDEGSAIEVVALRCLGLSDWPDISYDVSSQDISVHIPLHRLLSLLLQKALRKCYGENELLNVNSASSGNSLSALRWDFFGHVLTACHPYGFSAFVMEHPLRNRVFCAEVHAGMWQRNGDSALLSCGLYRSVRCGGLDLELDLFLLQCCAALAPTDLYVNRILERFGLSSYLSLSLERSSEYEPVLVHEMLTLLIHIVKERRFCGQTTAESLKRELVCRLAISDATHSQLVKFFPHDLSKTSELQEVLDSVALYSNPSGTNQGMYSLKHAYWKELDLYYPRWNKRDLQDSEERYQYFCNNSPLTTQLPKWAKIYDPLKGVARVATCKVTLLIIRSVLYYAVMTNNLTTSRAPDTVLLTALHLLALALDICFKQKQSNDAFNYIGYLTSLIEFSGEEFGGGVNIRSGGQSLLSLLVSLMRMRKNEDLGYGLEAESCNLSSLIDSLLKRFAKLDSGCMIKLQRLAPEVVHLTLSISDSETNCIMSISDSEKRKAKARERQATMMEKMKAAQSKFLETMKSTSGDELNPSASNLEECKSESGNDLEDSAQDICSLCRDPNSGSRVSYLIFLQKSRLLSFIDRGPPSWKEDVHLGKASASTSMEQIIDQCESSTSSDTSEADLSFQFVQNVVNDLAYSGLSEDMNAFLEFIRTHCPTVENIQEPCISNDTVESFAYSFETLEDDLYLSICREMHCSQNKVGGDRLITIEQGLKKNRVAESVFIGKYISGLSKNYKNTSKLDCFGPSAVTTMLPAYDGFGPSEGDGIYLSSCGHCVHQECLDLYLSSLKERYSKRISFEGVHVVDPDKGEFLCPVCRRLSNFVLPALPGGSWKRWAQPVSSMNLQKIAGSVASSSERANYPQLLHALSLLQSASYVIGKGDVYKAFPMQRSGKINPDHEPIFYILRRMYFTGKHDQMSRSVRVSQSMIMWDILKYSLISMEIAARSGMTSLTPCYDLEALYERLKSSNGFIVSLFLKTVQRLRSKNPVHVLQRFRGIQLFVESISPDAFTYGSFDGVSGDNMIQILKHTEMDAAYPDIQFWKRACDPILAHDPFSSLMWVLFCLPHQFLSSEVSFLSLVHLFYAVSVTQAIVTYCSKYQGKSGELGYHDCLIADICKVMEEVVVPQQYFVSNYTDRSCNIKEVIRSLSFPYLRRCALLWKLVNCSDSAPFCDTTVMSDRTGSAAVELIEVEKLENMFKIHQLDILLKDETIRALALKWSHHFYKTFKGCNSKFVLYSTPAVPFKLMQLPNVYQDLVERYIKQCCPNCDPALCLLCGRLCSPSPKPCCRENGCQTHAMACGAGTGVFLLIRKTTILLQRSARLALWPSTFLDAYGEEDTNMVRGKPLYMNEERYATLTQMVVSHGLDQSSKVLRQTTIGSFFTF